MGVSYKRLQHQLIDREMTLKELQVLAGYSANVSTKITRNENISLDSLEKICKVLHCRIEDVVEFTEEENFDFKEEKAHDQK